MYNTSDVKRELSKTQKECLALATDSNASIVSIMLNAGGYIILVVYIGMIFLVVAL